MAGIDEIHDDSGLLTFDVKQRVAAALWVWYYAHQNDDFPVKIWFFTYHLSYHSLYPFMIALLGRETEL